MNRFKISFDNSVAIRSQNFINNSVSSKLMPASRGIGLNAPMIDRIYKAKPGCSACGKKVA